MKTPDFRNHLKAISKSNVHLKRLARILLSIYRKFRRRIRTYPGIPGRIHYNDDSFYNSSISHYISVGQSALDNIEHALQLSNKTFQDIGKGLDFPCGYGRITRVLQNRLSESAVLDVCDILPEAVRFCAQEFGVDPILSQNDISNVVLPNKYDLIWIGSLLTHLDRQSFVDTLKIASDSLAMEGVMVFTTHGNFSLEILDSYGIKNLNRKEVKKHLQETGFYFAPYSGESDYGISLSSVDFVRSLLENDFPSRLKLLFYKPQGWDNHQDVFACQKTRLLPD
ncbi:class I SAM-dependent methyltransferase [Acidobacteriota bacterium]